MKTLEIGLPVTPSTHLSFDIILATEMVVTWGGGIGGSSKKYYAIESKNMSDYVLLNGEEIYINSEFVVTRRKVRIAKVVTDITAHKNHIKETCEKSILTQFLLINFDEISNLNVTSYVDNSKRLIDSDLDEY